MAQRYKKHEICCLGMNVNIFVVHKNYLNVRKNGDD